MTPNKRDLKAFVRFDGSGRVVSSSLILRKQKPKVGKWMEVQAYQCCNGPSVITTPGDDLPSTNFSVSIACDGTEQNVSFVLVGAFTTITAVVAALNLQFGFIGTFSVAENGTDIIVTLSEDMAETFRGCDITVTSSYNP
jgi:hypothetical protein